MRAFRGHDSRRRCCFRSAGARESGRNVTARRPKADAAIQEPQGALRSLDRRVASLLGLTPRQNSTGGKEKVGAITKQGNRYRRKMLVVGCTSALRVAGKRNGALAAWIAALRARKPERLVAMALANKLARICWAIMTTGEVFRQEIFAKA
jgi:transposase